MNKRIICTLIFSLLVLTACSSETPNTTPDEITPTAIIETQAGDISAYIPTNVISITDGQIFLESDLFFSGQRPAVNAGLSVSRVGGDAQIKAMKKVSGSMKLELAQYRELKSFAQFGSDLDKETQAVLDKGERIMEILKQPQHSPVKVEHQVMIIYAVTRGYLQDVEVENIQRFEGQFLEFMDSTYAAVGRAIVADGKLEEKTEQSLKEALEEFKRQFQQSL